MLGAEINISQGRDHSSTRFPQNTHIQPSAVIIPVIILISLQTFAFDHCFWSMDPEKEKFADQEEVFNHLGLDLLQNAFKGYNACIFAYGQTGSYVSWS